MTLLFFLISLAQARTAVIGVENLAAAEPVCVVKADVELHVAPDQKSKISWLVGMNMPFLKLREQRDRRGNLWFQLRDLDNQRHWIRASAVSNRVTCAVIKRDGASLRIGPGEQMSEAVYPTVHRYTPFRKIDRDGEWVSLEDDYGGQYWAHERDLWIPAKRSGISF